MLFLIIIYKQEESQTKQGSHYLKRIFFLFLSSSKSKGYLLGHFSAQVRKLKNEKLYSEKINYLLQKETFPTFQEMEIS